MKLTIGMPSYDNYQEVWFTVQALRLYQDLEDCEILIIDNYGENKKLSSFPQGNDIVRVVKYTENQSPAHAKNKVFEEAQGEWVICIDSHIFLPKDAIAKIKQFITENNDSKNLYQGPMLYDNLITQADHFTDVWSSDMWGQWANSGNTSQDPYEIPKQGCGFMMCRKDAWLGFSEKFKGFGGEEGYIQEKFRQTGHKAMCIPWIKWSHYFRNSSGKQEPIPYTLSREDRIHNYVVGFTELGLSLDPIKEYFKIDDAYIQKIIKDSGVQPLYKKAPVKIEQGKLSVIIPYVNEYPQNVFTVASIHEELEDINHEIIVVNNTGSDAGKEAFDKAVEGQAWLKSVEYTDKLSCWNARRVGVEHSTGDILFFSDAHCIIGKNSLTGMYKYYTENLDKLHGTMHLPLTYKILEHRKLIYKPIIEVENGLLHYQFSTFRDADEPYEVPVMSTCGMIIQREIYDKIGGYPEELGIWGGGENFINYVLPTLGYKKWVYPKGVLRHHGEKRGYSYTYKDLERNRIIAFYLVGGKKWANRYVESIKDKYTEGQAVADEIFIKLKAQRQMIVSQQVISIDDWLKQELNIPVVPARKRDYAWHSGGGSAIGKEDGDFIIDILKQYKPSTVLEFGVGVSTQLFKDNGLDVTTYEKEAKYAEGTDAKLWNGVTINDDNKYDLAFVDGPCGGESREHSTRLAGKLSDIVIVHDAWREWDMKWQEKHLKAKGFKLIKTGGYQGRYCNLWEKTSESQ